MLAAIQEEIALRKPFYQIDESMYLLPTRTPKPLGPDGPVRPMVTATPEEAIRQWCVFELMRAYGVMFADLEFEHPVRVGSTKYRIDILIWRNGSPWTVVECKKAEHTKHQDGVDQAISYAGAEEIRAEYAVYTNGTKWLVNRQIHERWVPVPDLPQRVDRHVGIPLDEVMHGLEDIGPLLYKLDEPIEKSEAQAFLETMQRFFNGHSILTQDVDRDLRFAADNLLRVLAKPGEHANYRSGKLLTALSHLEQYRTAAKLDGAIFVPHQMESVESEIRSLHGELYGIIEGTRGLVEPNALVLRIVSALTEYGMSQSQRTPYPKISHVLHHAVRSFLEYMILRYLNFELPDVADTGTWSDLKSYFASEWETRKADVR